MSTTPEHEHDWWRTPSGALECACGASRRSNNDPTNEDPKETN